MLKVIAGETSFSRALETAAPPSWRHLKQVNQGVEAAVSSARDSGSPSAPVVGSPSDENCDGLKIRVQTVRLRPWAQRGSDHHGGYSASPTTTLSPGSRCAIRGYAAGNYWLDRRDLEQEAVLSLLEERRRKPGLDLDEATIVTRTLWRFVMEQRCPVHLPERNGGLAVVAASVRRESLEATTDDGVEVDNPAVATVAAEQFEPLEARLDRARAMAEVRSILDEESEAAKAVLLGEEKSAEVAARMGLSVRQVYQATAQAMKSLRAALCPEIA